ncbi:MAG: LysR family transcriptional regulator [Myxococcales bacterium]
MSAKLSELSAFLSVATHLNFRAAARERGITPSAVSHALRSLEEELGVRLLQRTTRSVSLTEAGALLFARLKPAFGEIDHAVEAVNSFRETPYGRLRLNVPRAAGAELMGVFAQLVSENPGLTLEVVADDRLVDIVAGGFDAGIRFGEKLAKDMVAVRVALPLSFAVVGSPAYFKGRALPKHPADLGEHRCIRYRFPSGANFPWEFEKAGKTLEVDVQGPLVLDDQQLMIEAALSGVGLAYVFTERVASQLQAGRLVRCLADYCPPFTELFLYYPERTYVSAGLRALIKLLKHTSKAARASGSAHKSR